MNEEESGVKEEESISSEEIIKSLILVIILIIIGSLAIIFAIQTKPDSPLFTVSLTIGITSIVSLVTVVVDYILRKRNMKLTELFFDRLEEKSTKLSDALKERIENKTIVIEERMNKIDRKLELAGKLSTSGLIDILSDRWENERKFHEKIRNYLCEYVDQIKRSEVKEKEKEIWIMGIALKHFFQNETYKDELKKLNELNVKFKVLLLDVESEGAFERSKIESPEIYDPNYLKGFTDEENKNYNLFVDTAMFRELYGAHDYIVNNSAMWIKNFDIKYYNNEPSYFLVRFPDKLIVETYHYGSVKECEIPSDRPTTFSGGRIPIFVFDSKCVTYKLISNHFNQIWRRSSITPNDRVAFFSESIQQKNSQFKRRNKNNHL